MKTIRVLPFVLLALWSCSNSNTSIKLSNNLNKSRTDEGITISREQIAKWTRIPENKIPVVFTAKDAPLACQANDLNGDGTWDELFILAEFDSLETKEVFLDFLPESKLPVFTARTNIRFGDKTNNYTELSKAIRLRHADNTETSKMFQMEGPAWENDLVAFRNYFDQRNGMDIFGKTTAKMVLDSVGIEGFPGYHDLSWWGMDILKVNTSLGAGSIGIDLNDSIYRLGDNGTGNYSLLYDGPVESAFELGFSDWKMGQDSVNAKNTISIQAGKYYYTSTLLINKCEKPVLMVTGIVNRKSHELHTVNLNNEYTAFYTFDHQAEDSTLLAMAITVSNSDLVSYGKTTDSGAGITETYFVRLKISNEEPVSYRFYSFWERENPQWKDPLNIEKQLKTDAECFGSPIEVTLAK